MLVSESQVALLDREVSAAKVGDQCAQFRLRAEPVVMVGLKEHPADYISFTKKSRVNEEPELEVMVRAVAFLQE